MIDTFGIDFDGVPVPDAVGVVVIAEPGVEHEIKLEVSLFGVVLAELQTQVLGVGLTHAVFEGRRDIQELYAAVQLDIRF